VFEWAWRGLRRERVARTAHRLVEVDVDALELQVRVAVVRAGGVHAMLVADHLPELQGRGDGWPDQNGGLVRRRQMVPGQEGSEGASTRPPSSTRREAKWDFPTHLGTDLVAALAGLHVHNLTHVGSNESRRRLWPGAGS
jgi:hypothetical protein